MRHSGLPEADKLQPESSESKYFQNIWTPVFTGVTTYSEFVTFLRHQFQLHHCVIPFCIDTFMGF